MKIRNQGIGSAAAARLRRNAYVPAGTATVSRGGRHAAGFAPGIAAGMVEQGNGGRVSATGEVV